MSLAAAFCFLLMAAGACASGRCRKRGAMPCNPRSLAERYTQLKRPKLMTGSDDELPPYRTASSSWALPPMGYATQGPSMEKAVADADEAALEMEVMRGIFKKEDSKLRLVKRLYKEKMARSDKSADDVNASAVEELRK